MAGRAQPALPQYLTAMKREIKKALTRVRRAQDAAANGKVEFIEAMSVDTNSRIDSKGERLQWWTIYVHKSTDPKFCQHFSMHDNNPEEAEPMLAALSEYMNYPV